MNFLIHCAIPDLALDAPHPDLIAGGFLGDFVKGPVPDTLPPALATGVRLHRRLDAFSNQQPDIRTSCDRFPPHLRRFAPIFVDVVADHLLARHWHEHHAARLDDFTAAVYRAINAHRERLPESGLRFYRHMAQSDLLAGYRDWDTVARSLAAVVRRLNRADLDADEVAHAAKRVLAGLDADFQRYFPELVTHARDWLDNHG